MERISTFVYCESVQNENTPTGIKNNILGPMNALRPMYIPGTFSFSIFLSILGIDLSKTHIMKIIFTDGKENIVNTGDSQLPAQDLEPDLPESERGFMMNMDLRNVVLKKEGIYKTQVYFDDKLLGEYPIYVQATKDV
ncbi:DUF6941 family protein [Clostridium butyricum]